MTTKPLNILLADDDTDDCFIFREVMEELLKIVNLTTVNDGIQLIQLISEKSTPIPDAIFLDLNMPKKNGFECLGEIKIMDKYMNIPVFIYSTSLNHVDVDLLYAQGACYYICKPIEYDNLKKVLLKAITLIAKKEVTQPPRGKFILKP